MTVLSHEMDCLLSYFMMKCVIVTLMLCVHYTSSQFMPIPKPKSPCDSSAKNSLVEHFFNIIFTEFHTSPPVCVCVQMCTGQSTYCYPNGCLKRDDLKRVDSPLIAPQAKGDRKHQYMFVVDEKSDFMKDYLEKTYSDDSMTVTPGREIREMRSDIFKDKYNMLGKHRKVPNVELRYNLREQVKNMKSDLLRIEAGDLSKTRWPMNKRNLISGHKIQSKLEKRTPIVGKANYFMAMLPANDISGYPLKYFKRDTEKSFNDETNVKDIYLIENSDNDTDVNANNETFSLETLIENLINNSFQTKHHNTRDDAYKNLTTKSDAKNDETNVKVTDIHIDTTEAVTTEHTFNETMDVLSINSTNEKVDKNKYNDDYVSNTSNIINEMIKSLSKRIEKQNNTSLEIAKRVVSDFDNDETTTVDTETTAPTDISEQITTPTANFMEMMTMKNRQKRAKQKHAIKETN